ncbi:MAG: S-adenosylmethionine:tRNA ribosyltransferase-isomerase [Polyangiaceae bacterium]
MKATILAHHHHPRLLRLRFDLRGDALVASALPRRSRRAVFLPSQAFEPWDVQTVYASRPWAAEMPSAGRPLTWGLLLEAVAKGVQLASLTHAAGLSSTGDATLDAMLPLSERYEIPQETIDAIRATRERGGRIIAVGTSVVRALEGCVFERGKLISGPGVTTLRIGPGFTPTVIDGLLTGMHEPHESHFDLLEAFAPHALLERAHQHAIEAGYEGHELGDSALILAGIAA